MATKSGTCDKTIVVIPTYNEAETIGELLADLNAREYGCVVVDDSESPETSDIAAKKGAYVIRRFQRQGLGTATKDGLDYARLMSADFAVVMDAGGTHRPEDVPTLEMVARRFGFDVVIGSRFMGQYETCGWRTALSRGGTWLSRGLGLRVSDATNGFRCYRLDDRLFAALDITLAEGHAFQFELLTNLVRRGAKVGEVGIPYQLVGKSTLRVGTVIEAMETYVRLLFQHL